MTCITRKASTYDYYVGNLGHVQTLRTKSPDVADSEYEAWVEQSKAPHGRASNESVTVFKDGQFYREYQPKDQHE